MLLWGLLSGLLMSIAWWFPGTIPCAVLGFLSVLMLARMVQDERCRYRDCYAVGLVENTLGFYWLYHTIADFGGFGVVLSSLLFLFFVTVSSIQHLLFFFVYKNIRAVIPRAGIAVALAWATSECLSIRIFPWHAGHTLLASPFAQAADIGGTLLLSFFLCASAEILANFTRVSSFAKTALPVTAAVLIWYGMNRIEEIRTAPGDALKLGVVQANINVFQKGDMKFFAENTDRYIQLTEALPENLLVIWPESVVQDLVWTETKKVFHDSRLPQLKVKRPLLTGSLMINSQKQIFNSALGILADGTILPPVHKIILMPFGEFMPFSKTLPFLAGLNPAGSELSPGSEVGVIQFRHENGRPFLITPLICYEDVVPALSREGTNKGAELLVNLTNDAWFGDTLAPLQHHLIASFRAIENRRYLVRSTNSGLTAIVNPLGETEASLPVFSEGTLIHEVALRKDLTFYTRHFGDLPWMVFAWSCLISSIILRIRKGS